MHTFNSVNNSSLYKTNCVLGQIELSPLVEGISHTTTRTSSDQHTYFFLVFFFFFQLVSKIVDYAQFLSVSIKRSLRKEWAPVCGQKTVDQGKMKSADRG